MSLRAAAASEQCRHVLTLLSPLCHPQASDELLKQHYVDLKDRPFFPTLINYMSSGPVVAMVRTHNKACARLLKELQSREHTLTVCPLSCRCGKARAW